MEHIITDQRMIVCITYTDEASGKRIGRNYGYWKPKPDLSHLEEARAFVNAKHGGAEDIEVTIYLVENVTVDHVEDVTGTGPQQVSIAANSIGYALQEAGVEFSTELALKAAQRLADQGLLK